MNVLITALSFPCSAPAAASPPAFPKTERQNHLLPYFSDLFCSYGLSHFLLQLPEYLWKEGEEPGCAAGQVWDQGREHSWGSATTTVTTMSPKGHLLSFSTPTPCWEQWGLWNLWGEESEDEELMSNSFLCGLRDPNPSQIRPVLGETHSKELWLPEVFLIAFPSSPKKSLAAFHKPIFSFSVNTLGCAHSALTRRWILCSHFLSLLFLCYSHSRARAGSHLGDLQKIIPLCKADPASGWNRLTNNKSGSNQTKIQKEISFLPSLSYPFISPYSNNSKLCESLWNTINTKIAEQSLGEKFTYWVFCGTFISRLQWVEATPCSQITHLQKDVHFKQHQPRGFLCMAKLPSLWFTQQWFTWSWCSHGGITIFLSPPPEHSKNSQTPVKNTIPKS